MTNLGHLVANAFRPATEMDDPRLFAGRRKEVRALVEALHTDGACPVIYGDRGLGKSSLALQGEWIAAGDTQLLDQYGMLEWNFGEEDYFIPVYVTCPADVRSTSDVLQRAINALVAAGEPGRGPSNMVERTETIKLSLLKVFETEEVTKYVQPEQQTAVANFTPGEVLVDLANKVAKRTGHPVLMIVDEVDRVEDTTGLGAFIKTASSPNLRFLLVGIAQNLSELLADHLSIERSCVPIHVPQMTLAELRAIMDRAEEYLRMAPNSRYRLAFTGEAKAELADLAAGFPWFVHVLGQAALSATLRGSGRSVTTSDIYYAVHDLTSNRFAQQFSDLYHQAVKNSERRETVLRALAAWPATDIPIADVYKTLKEQLDVPNPEYYKAQMCQPRYGSVLAPAPFPGKHIVRFRNHMFKVYISMRPSLNPGVDYLVADAYGTRQASVFAEAVRGRMGRKVQRDPHAPLHRPDFGG